MEALVVRARPQGQTEQPFSLASLVHLEFVLCRPQRSRDHHRLDFGLRAVQHGPIGPPQALERTAAHKLEGLDPASRVGARRGSGEQLDVGDHRVPQAERSALTREMVATIGRSPQGASGVGGGRVHGGRSDRSPGPHRIDPHVVADLGAVQGQIHHELAGRAAAEWMGGAANLQRSQHGNLDLRFGHIGERSRGSERMDLRLAPGRSGGLFGHHGVRGCVGQQHGSRHHGCEADQAGHPGQAVRNRLMEQRHTPQDGDHVVDQG